MHEIDDEAARASAATTTTDESDIEPHGVMLAASARHTVAVPAAAVTSLLQDTPRTRRPNTIADPREGRRRVGGRVSVVPVSDVTQ